MLYSLVLVVFMHGGLEHRTVLKYEMTDEACIDARDSVRSYVNYYNYLETKGKDDFGEEVEFVDAECQPIQEWH